MCAERWSDEQTTPNKAQDGPLSRPFLLARGMCHRTAPGFPSSAGNALFPVDQAKSAHVAPVRANHVPKERKEVMAKLSPIPAFATLATIIEVTDRRTATELLRIAGRSGTVVARNDRRDDAREDRRGLELRVFRTAEGAALLGDSRDPRCEQLLAEGRVVVTIMGDHGEEITTIAIDNRREERRGRPRRARNVRVADGARQRTRRTRRGDEPRVLSFDRVPGTKSDVTRRKAG